ncbi:MAG: hypothetical protein P1V20_19110 [Verrucomicrobiales bacterium]|nr:hypothetical protein [Verrucomicrobiales bacterium]
MFSTKEFIEASRNYVCVRLESYESEEHQQLVRSFLNGRFENTAFCILEPDAETRLTGSSRSPHHIMGRTNDQVIAEMTRIAKLYRKKGGDREMALQDFHSFRQALNVASADQRLLLFVSGNGGDLEKVKSTLRPVFADSDVMGRFHLDFADENSDADWTGTVSRSSDAPGMYLIQADRFGQHGAVVAAIPLTVESADLKSALLEANREFAESEARKVYSDHVSEGREKNVFFKNGMPYGEDRDGDGKIDPRGAKGGKGRKGRGGGAEGRGRPAEVEKEL